MSSWKPRLGRKKSKNNKSSSKHEERRGPVPVADYSNLTASLPDPPVGFTWKREKNREWSLVPTAVERTDVKSRSMSMSSKQHNDEQQQKDEWSIVKKDRSNSFASNASSITMEQSTTGNGNNNGNTTHYPYYVDEGGLDDDDYDHDGFSYAIMSNNCMNSHGHFVEHIILPTDTLQGICIQYKVSATRLRQLNQFSGSSLLLAPKRLLVPMRTDESGEPKLQDNTTEEYKLHKVLSECPTLGLKEIRVYLDLCGWEVESTITAAKADTEWEKSQSDSVEECKSSIDPPSTSYFRIQNAGVSVNLRLQQENHRFNDSGSLNKGAENLVELKAIKDAADRWEELSHPGSYKSCVDNSEKIPLLVVGLPIHNVIKNVDFHKAPPMDFGIEMKEISSMYDAHPSTVSVPR